VFAVLRAASCELFGYGFLMMYALASSSPYYYLSLALIPVIFWNSGRGLRRYAIWGTIALFAVHMEYFRGVYFTWEYLPNLLSNASIALFLIGLAVVSLIVPESPSLSPSQSPKA
jgi:hypothetical protein